MLIVSRAQSRACMCVGCFVPEDDFARYRFVFVATCIVVVAGSALVLFTGSARILVMGSSPWVRHAGKLGHQELEEKGR